MKLSKAMKVIKQILQVMSHQSERGKSQKRKMKMTQLEQRLIYFFILISQFKSLGFCLNV